MNLTANIQFIGQLTEPPKLHGITREKDHCPLIERQLQVSDLRDCASPPTLDEAGFTLVQGDRLAFGTSLETVAHKNLEQATALVTQISGATQLIHMNSVIRRSERSPLYMQGGTTLPARFAHSDYGAGEREILRWLNHIMKTDSRSLDPYQRVAMYNTWRTLTPPPADVPLALCDVRSLGSDDRVAVDFFEQMPEDPDWFFKMSVYRFNECQRWGYFSGMQDDEFILFKGFDSDPNRAALTPHAAFTASNCPASAEPRASIESRFLALFY
ncbi:MAG: CmcJ/NvfI family oxidoreductase [Pseudomonadota bacterium]|nr:CmcJ/NvfI family oxidoreductase [Pseudomonadota bacterium]